MIETSLDAKFGNPGQGFQQLSYLDTYTASDAAEKSTAFVYVGSEKQKVMKKKTMNK